MVAILAVRTTDGTGSPVLDRSSSTRSPRQPRFCKLVIINTQTKPKSVAPPATLPSEMASARQNCQVGRLV
jgi:hypothetical protein